MHARTRGRTYVQAAGGRRPELHCIACAAAAPADDPGRTNSRPRRGRTTVPTGVATNYYYQPAFAGRPLLKKHA